MRQISTIAALLAALSLGGAQSVSAADCDPSTSVSPCATLTCAQLGQSTMDQDKANLITCLWSDASHTQKIWKSMTNTTAIPTGTIAAFALGACPSGWSALDGSGGFPDARGRTLIGAGTGSGLTKRDLLTYGGEETHKLTGSEMPSHNHASGGCNGGVSVSGDGGSAMCPGWFYYPTTSAGGDQPHNIMQPWLAVLFCEKN